MNGEQRAVCDVLRAVAPQVRDLAQGEGLSNEGRQVVRYAAAILGRVAEMLENTLEGKGLDGEAGDPEQGEGRAACDL